MARSTSDPDQEYIYFMGSETLPSACYILSDESSIHFYSTSTGIKTRFSSSQMKMFVPLFVGLYASHLSFRVLETLWVYKVA